MEACCNIPALISDLNCPLPTLTLLWNAQSSPPELPAVNLLLFIWHPAQYLPFPYPLRWHVVPADGAGLLTYGDKITIMCICSLVLQNMWCWIVPWERPASYKRLCLRVQAQQYETFAFHISYDQCMKVWLRCYTFKIHSYMWQQGKNQAHLHIFNSEMTLFQHKCNLHD